MSRQENKKSIGFMIFAIILSVILVVFTGGLIYQIFKLQILPDNILTVSYTHLTLPTTSRV